MALGLSPARSAPACTIWPGARPEVCGCSDSGRRVLLVGCARKARGWTLPTAPARRHAVHSRLQLLHGGSAPAGRPAPAAAAVGPAAGAPRAGELDGDEDRAGQGDGWRHNARGQQAPPAGRPPPPAPPRAQLFFRGGDPARPPAGAQRGPRRRVGQEGAAPAHPQVLRVHPPDAAPPHAHRRRARRPRGLLSGGALCRNWSCCGELSSHISTCCQPAPTTPRAPLCPRRLAPSRWAPRTASRCRR